MKVVIAPDSFKESVSASEAANAIAQGVLDACPDAEVVLCPMADGGEGTVAAMVAATGGRTLAVDVYGPLGEPRRAGVGLLGNRSSQPGLPGELGLTGAMTENDGDEDAPATTAVVEMASASGLALVPPEARDPRQTTTFGTGQLILAALDAGAREVIVGLGGSATCDGGCGAAQAMGVTFIAADGPAVCGLAGGGLRDLRDFDLSDLDQRVRQASIRVACDVNNPLTGPDGAAAVFGPQKGATPEIVAELDEGLRHLADLIADRTGVAVDTIPGGGAAGGLAAGLVAFAGATLEGGVELVAEAVGLRRRLNGADLCITGEGLLDRSSLFGKVTVGVARIAGERDVPTWCFPGQVAPDAPISEFDGVWPMVAGETEIADALADPAGLLRRRVARALGQKIGNA